MGKRSIWFKWYYCDLNMFFVLSNQNQLLAYNPGWIAPFKKFFKRGQANNNVITSQDIDNRARFR